MGIDYKDLYIKPSAHAQEGYSSLPVCMYVRTCMSVNALIARVMISAIQTWHYHNRHDTYNVLTRGFC